MEVLLKFSAHQDQEPLVGRSIGDEVPRVVGLVKTINGVAGVNAFDGEGGSFYCSR